MNAVSFSGSNNETASGWLGNIEEFKTFKSWESGQQTYLESDKKKFDAFWNHKRKGVQVERLPEAVAEKLIEIGKDFDIDSIAVHKYFECANPEVKRLNKLRLFYYQEDAVEKWVNNDKKLLLEMATGTGKTRTAIGCIRYALQNQRKPIVIVISCPQDTLTMQWKVDIEQLDLDATIDAVQICDGNYRGWRRELKTKCQQLTAGLYDSLLIYTTHQTCSNADFIETLQAVKRADRFFIGDEVHGMGASKTRKGLLEEYNMRLGLSATPSRWFDDEGSSLIAGYFGDNSYKFTIEQALSTPNPMTNKPFLVNYTYHPCFITLTDDELEEYKQLSEKITRMNNSKNKEEFADKTSLNLYGTINNQKFSLLNSHFNSYTGILEADYINAIAVIDQIVIGAYYVETMCIQGVSTNISSLNYFYMQHIPRFCERRIDDEFLANNPPLTADTKYGKVLLQPRLSGESTFHQLTLKSVPTMAYSFYEPKSLASAIRHIAALRNLFSFFADGYITFDTLVYTGDTDTIPELSCDNATVHLTHGDSIQEVNAPFLLTYNSIKNDFRKSLSDRDYNYTECNAFPTIFFLYC